VHRGKFAGTNCKPDAKVAGKGVLEWWSTGVLEDWNNGNEDPWGSSGEGRKG
jgi:hypothetical protein